MPSAKNSVTGIQIVPTVGEDRVSLQRERCDCNVGCLKKTGHLDTDKFMCHEEQELPVPRHEPTIPDLPSDNIRCRGWGCGLGEDCPFPDDCGASLPLKLEPIEDEV